MAYENGHAGHTHNPFLAASAMPAGMVPETESPDRKDPCDTKVDSVSC